MTETLANGENVELRGFGSFTIREYDSYTGKNLKTGEIAQHQTMAPPLFDAID
jgi:integration host factor subunit beta